jgi:forkhead transcription factor HCM1
MPPPHANHYPTDSLAKKQMSSTYQQNHGTNAHVEPFPTFAPQAQFDKENVYTVDTLSQTTLYMQKSTQRRKATSNFSGVPLGERGQRKQKKNSVHQEAPVGPASAIDISSLPIIEDDGDKPAMSYSQLIAMAILRAPNRRLTLAQIYKWISESYSFYRKSPDGGWQNSVRHNLSLNKAFTKQERPKDDPGKGHYWSIQPGHEAQFINGKTKSASHSSFNASAPKRSSISHTMSSQPSISKSVDSSRFPDEEEPSSDATIPASDPAIHDGLPADDSMMPPPAKFLRSSPPPAIHSSPPQIPAVAREGTPPAVGRFAIPSSRPNGGRKRKHSLIQSGLGDSGYYSSIESSAIRNPRPYLTSEVDSEHPIHKRGRAEEELARIRSSSYDSPSKPNLNPSIFVSSSPFRARDSATAHGPTTPSLLFKKPMRPPLSISPNTNLRNHRKHVRKLLGSPDKTLGVMESPFVPLEVPQNDLFELTSHNAFPDILNESPLRPKTALTRSAKRPRLERANTTAGILADITGSGHNGVNSRHADLKNPPLLPPGKLESPSRLGGTPSKRVAASPLKDVLPADHISMFDSPNFLRQTLFEATGTSLKPLAEGENEEDDSFMYALNLPPSDDSDGGVDILQGFTRIGEAAAQQNRSPTGTQAEATDAMNAFLLPEQFLIAHQSPSRPPKNGGRPGIGRSSTSLF